MNKTVRLGDIRPLDTILETRPLNGNTVSHYRQNIRVGVEFPKIIVWKRRGRKHDIICGNQRHAAFLAEFGKDYEIVVEVREFDALVDALEFAVRDNITHGEPYDGISRKRAILKLIELGRSPEAVASLIGIAVDRVVILAGEAVIVRNGSQRVSMPVKRGIEHMHGRTVTKADYADHIKKDEGRKAVYLAEQLTRHIGAGWVDLSDEGTVSALKNLRVALDKLFSVK